MYQIDNSTAAATQPASTTPGTAGWFTDGSVGGGVAPTVVPAEWLNAVQAELCNLVTAAGGTLTKNAFSQVAQAIQSCLLNTAADTGVANAYACTFKPAISALTDGLKLSFQAAHANTGASTLNVNGLGAEPILGAAHAALQGGEIIAGGKIQVVWSATLSSFVMLEQTGGAKQVAPAAQSNQAINLGQFTGSNQSLANPGYQKLPGGLILQWGTVTTNGTTTKTVTFPIAFPNALLADAVVAPDDNLVSGQGATATTRTYTTKKTAGAASASGITFNYVAFGW